MQEVIIYTDGACKYNPGPGGWAAVLLMGSERQELSGGVKATTNNRMELTAVIRALQAVPAPAKVKVHSDSAYIVNCIQQGWYKGWQRNGWLTAKRTAVENRDLWEELLELIRLHQVEFVKVKGHSDVALNNLCDQLARASVPSANRSS